MTKHITKKSPRIASDANAMTQKGNVLLYLDKDLVGKSRELWFSLSRTFENHLKQLITLLSNTQPTHNNLPLENKSSWWTGTELGPNLE